MEEILNTRVESLESTVKILEEKIKTLEAIVEKFNNSSTKSPPDSPKKLAEQKTANTLVYKYKNSLMLVSESKINGTYGVKEQIKQCGAKWSNITDNANKKYLGWMYVGIIKDISPDAGIEKIINELKLLNVDLCCDYKGEIEKKEVENGDTTINLVIE
jgi:hypothetical protein